MNKQNQKTTSSKSNQLNNKLVRAFGGRFSIQKSKCEEILEKLSSKHSTQMVMELLYDCYDLSNGGIAELDGPDVNTDSSLLASLSEYKTESEASLNRGSSGLRMFSLFMRDGRIPRIVYDLFYKQMKPGVSDPNKLYEATYILDTLCINQFVFEPSQHVWLSRLHARTGQKIELSEMIDELFINLQLMPHGKELILHLSGCKKEYCNCSGSRKLVGHILTSIRDWMKLDLSKISIFEYLRGMSMSAVREFIRASVIFQNEIESTVIDSETS